MVYYHVFSGTNLDEYNKTINEYLNKGWVLEGNINVTNIREVKHYTQAMVKTVEKKTEI